MTTVDEMMVRLFRAPHILVVQDTTAPVVGLLHRNYECYVDATDSGEKAIKLLMEEKYDLVIVDLALLNGTSRKVIATVERYAPETPVVATSIDQVTVNEVLESGPLTVLSGPLTEQMIANLFRLFKIRARTREIVEYCARRLAPETGRTTAAAIGA